MKAPLPALRSLPLRPASRRPGAMLFELMISGVLLGVVLSSVIPTLGWIARERQLSRRRQAALLEVGNLMERVTLLDWEELTSDRAAKFELSETLQRELPDARLTIRVTDDAEAHARQVLIELRWETTADRPAPPVRLAAWVHQREPIHGDKN
jgi:hypothetical protein